VCGCAVSLSSFSFCFSLLLFLVLLLQEGTRVEALLHSATLAKRDISFAPLPIDEAIRMISDAGGKSVLAHLPTLKHWKKKVGCCVRGRLCLCSVAHLPRLVSWNVLVLVHHVASAQFLPLLEELADRGLWGVEVFSAEVRSGAHAVGTV